MGFELSPCITIKVSMEQQDVLRDREPAITSLDLLYITVLLMVIAVNLILSPFYKLNSFIGMCVFMRKRA